MTQASIIVGNNPGAVVRSNLNDALEGLSTLQSGGTAPATTYPNQWWFDTSTNILKQRDNTNNYWINVAYKDGVNWTPYSLGALLTAIATASFASQAQAEAGTDQATVMNPLRVAQAIAALGGGNYKVFTSNRSLTTASGTQVISGLGITPTHVIFFGGMDNVYNLMLGFSDVTTNYGHYARSAGLFGRETSQCLKFFITASDYQAGAISAMGAGQFTITWTKTGSPTGTGFFGGIAFA